MTTAQKPNIILIFIDDLGYGDLSCFNPNSKIHTAQIDKVAEAGMKFTDCHSSSALCTPSRYGLLTGRYNWRSRLKASVLPGQSFPLIEEGRETLASLLKKNGYRTACVGKWHLGLGWRTKAGYRLPATYEEPAADQDKCAAGIDFSAPITDGPITRGFDYFYGMPASLDQPPFVHIENDRVLTPPDHMMGVKMLSRHDPSQPFDVEYGPAEPGYDPREMVPEMDAKVLELVDRYAGEAEPFFLYYPTLAVHGPLVPAPEFQGKSGLGAYGDFVLQVDDFVGRLTRKLEETGIADNTMLLFASDNGCSPVADFPALIAQGHDPSADYRGWKADIWEGGHRIPFLVRWPGHVPAGTACDRLVCLTDLFATLAQITGACYGDGAGEDSLSILPLLEGKDVTVRDAVVHHAADGSFSIRRGDWKLALCRGSGGMRPPCTDKRQPPYQLYDLSEDAGERHNLYEDHPEIAAELTALLRDYVLSGRSTPGAPQSNCPCDNWPGLGWMEEEPVHAPAE